MEKDRFSQYSDEELILRIRDGESDGTDYLMEKYKSRVRLRAKSMYLLGADTEDLIQEGMIGLFKAVRDYDAGRDSSFATFAELCITRQIYNAVEASRRKKHQPLNSSIPLEGLNNEAQKEVGEHLLKQTGTRLGGRSPEELIIDNENMKTLEALIEQELSPFEKQVLELSLTGMSYTEIARVLGRDAKSADNALQRIRSKVRRAVAEKKEQELL